MLEWTALTKWTQKLKPLGRGRKSTYTLQHPHSRAARDEGANVSPCAARDEGANVEIKGVEAEMKPLPGLELETSGFDTMLGLNGHYIQ